MRRTQQGQALPLGLALILFGILGGFALYNVGQSATEKARLVNTADAAAYSGVLWQARALNFQAYTNRAMVANQVSIAQAVSLNSWMNYAEVTAENAATALSVIPFVGQFLEGVRQAVSAVNEIIGPITEAMVTVVDTVISGIAIAQEAMHYSTYVATPEIVSEVVKTTDDRFSIETAYTVAGVVGNLVQWNGFTTRIDAADDPRMEQKANIVMASRDDFSRDRGWSLFDDWLRIVPLIKTGVFKEGETRLVRNGDDWEWKAKDTLALHTKIKRPFRSNKHIELPVSYAASYANTQGGEDGTIEEGCENTWECPQWGRHNGFTESLADNNVPALRGTDSRTDMRGIKGLRAFRDLSDDTREDSFPTLKLRVEVKLDLAEIASSNDETSGETFRADLVAHGDRLSSISIAEVFFKNPENDRDTPQRPSAIEFANAYSPWWDVRLGAIPTAERLAAFALRMPGNSGVAPDRGGDGPEGADEDPAPSGDEVRTGAGGLTDPDSGDGPTRRAMRAGAGGGFDIQKFATAMGIDTLIPRGPVAVRSVVDAVAEQFGNLGNIENLENQIKEQLEEVLRTAVRDILAGMIGDATGNAFDQGVEYAVTRAETILENANIDSEAAAEAVEGAIDTIRGHQDDFERIEQAVSEAVEAAFGQTREEWDERATEIGARVDELAEQLTLPEHEGRQDEIRLEIADLNLELEDVQDDFVTDLAQQLVDIVDATGIEWRMPLALAEETIRHMLEARELEGEDYRFDLFDFDENGVPGEPGERGDEGETRPSEVDFAPPGPAIVDD